MMSALRELIETTSRFGRYQVMQIVLCFVAIFSTSSQNFAIVFTSLVPKFTCDAHKINSTDDFQVNVTSGCSANGTCPSLQFTEEIQTLVTKYELVCDRSFLLPLIATFYMIGFFWGGPAYGYVSDRLGRRRGLLFSGLQTFVCAAIAALAPNYVMYIVFTTLRAFGASGVFSVVLTYGLECSSEKNKAVTLLITSLPWTVCMFSLCFVFYFTQSQTFLELLLAGQCLSTVVLYFLCQESPRWLLAKGRIEEAKTVLQRIVRMNKWTINIDADVVQECIDSNYGRDRQRRVTFKDLLTNSVLRRISLPIWYTFFTISLVFYGFAYGMSSLRSWTIYKRILVVASLQILVQLLFLIPITKYFERLWFCIASFLVIAAGSFTISGFVVDPESALIVTILCIIALPVSEIVFTVEDLYVIEVYPTTHRNFGLGCASAAARIGGIFASQMITLGKMWAPTPYIIYGGCSIIVILLKCLLPETKYHPCPETVEQVEELYERYCFHRRLRCRQRASGKGQPNEMSEMATNSRVGSS